MKLNWLETVQAGNMKRAEESMRTEKPRCISGKNTWDGEKVCTCMKKKKKMLSRETG